MSSYQQQEFDFKKKAQTVASNIQKISQNVSSLDRLLSSSHNDHQTVNQIHSITQYTHNLAKDTANDLKALANLSVEKSDRLMRDKLTSDFTSVLNNFQQTQRKAAAREKAQLRDFKHEIESETLVPPPPQSFKLKQMQEAEEESQIQELRARESAIRQLETDIMDVNQIFRELASLVHEQGETIDSIEAHVESSAIRVTEGTVKLQQASAYQTSSRKKKFCMFGTGAIILIILILIIVYTK